MPDRLGKHGSLVFLLDDQRRLIGIRDELRRKDPTPFREINAPKNDERDIHIEDSGPSWSVHFQRSGHSQQVPLYKTLNVTLSALEPKFQLAPQGFEHDESIQPYAKSGRYFYYHELDRPVSAMLIVVLVISEPFCYQIDCGCIEPCAEGFRLPSRIRLWVVGQIQPKCRQGILEFDLPPGKHELKFVVWSEPTSEQIQQIAIVLRRSESYLAALAYSWAGNQLLPIFPVDTQEEVEKTTRIIKEAGLRTSIVSAQVEHETLAKLRAACANVCYLPADSQLWPALAEALSVPLPEEGIPLGPDYSDLAVFLAQALASGVPLVPKHNENCTSPVPDLPDTLVDADGLVICDSDDPLVRILAVGYAHVMGLPVHLVEPDIEDPLSAPRWETYYIDRWPQLIADYRVKLTQQVNRIMPPWLQEVEPSKVIAFTRGFAYSLVNGPNGPWASHVAIGLLPEREAPWLLVRAIFQSKIETPPFSVTVLCDALTSETEIETEAELVRKATSSTVSQPLVLTGDLATSEATRVFSSCLPVDILALLCHGDDDSVFLADGPLQAEQIRNWHLPSAPLVVNNSCASWTTTGPSFLQAGARAYLGTLWPVRHRVAVEVSKGLTTAVTARSQVKLGEALQQAIMQSANLGIDDTLAYILVGLPDAPVRLSPLTDRSEETDLGEYGLQQIYRVADILARSSQASLSLFLRENIGQYLIEWLEEQILDSDIPGHLRVHNLEGEHLVSLVATLDSGLWRTLFTFGGEQGVPGGLEEVIKLHEEAVDLWQTGHERMCRRLGEPVTPDNDPGVQLVRVRTIAPILASLTTLLVNVGRHDEAWICACRTAHAVLRPDQPVPQAVPKGIGLSEIIRIGPYLPNPDDFFNSIGVVRFNQRDFEGAKLLYKEALKIACAKEDRAQEGRTRLNLAQVDMHQDRFGAAEEGFIEALAILDDCDDRYNAFITRVNQGELCLAKGDLKQAAAIAEDVRDRAAKIEWPWPIRQAFCDARRLQAAVLARLRRIDEAELVALQTLGAIPGEGPEPNRLVSAFAALMPEELNNDPASAAARCTRIHQKAIQVRDEAVAWKAALITLPLEGRAFNYDQDISRMKRCISLVSQVIELGNISDNPFIPEMKEGVAEFLIRNLDGFIRLLSEVDVIRLYEILSKLHPNEPRWAIRRELLTNTSELREYWSEAREKQEKWTRSAVVEISPPNRTRTVVTDVPPERIRRPLYLRYPLSIPTDGSVEVVDARIEVASCWMRHKNALYYRCDGKDAKIIIEKRGLVYLTGDRVIHYEEIWGSTYFPYDVIILLPISTVPVGLQMNPMRPHLLPQPIVTTHGQQFAIHLRPHPILEEITQFLPRILPDVSGFTSGVWMARVGLDFAPDALLYDAAFKVVSALGNLSFDAYIKELDKIVRSSR